MIACMANHPAPPLVVDPADMATLTTWSRSRALPQRLVMRARIVLLAGEGVPNTQIAAEAGTSLPTVQLWRSRYAEGGVAALETDRPGRGRPKVHGEAMVAKIISSTLRKPPGGRTHWSARLLAEHLGVSHGTVQRVWREHDLQPHRTRGFKYSTDPDLEAKVRDVIGLYLHPPEKALVLCVDEKSQIQALDRTQPLLPMRPGQVERRTHDYVRHGTATLFAAFDVASGDVTGRVYSRHRHQEFLKFLQVIDHAHPDVELHLVLDNYRTHKHPVVREWLAAHPRFHLHFTPTSASWMNQVETWFSVLHRQAIERGVFRSVRALMNAIQRFLDSWDDHKHPFVWVKTADDVLRRRNMKPISASVH
jgi:transposase